MSIEKKLKLLTDTLWQIKDKKDLFLVLQDLLTPSEIENIAERIEILKLLKKWLSQREIAKKLGISITTVTRWSRLLKYEQKAIWKYLDKIWGAGSQD